MAYTYNPISWTFDLDSEWEFYSKSEIDNLLATLSSDLNALVANKLNKNWINWTFTSNDWRTITVIDGQIISIV